VPVNILVADDSVTMRRILELTFQGEDAHVTSVDNGEAAVRKASELSPDVVFADLSMNGMDGYALASAIKSSPGLERTAVVLMASQKHPYDDDKGKAAGVDDHILKPFDTQQVIDRVKQVLSRPRVAPAARPAGASATAAAPSVASGQAANQQGRIGGKTIAFGKPPMAAPPPAPKSQAGSSTAQSVAIPVARPAASAAAASAAASVASPSVVAANPVAAVSAAAEPELQQRLSNIGLSPEQVTAVLALSREVIERVVWEVVPDLAETLIKEEIRRLTAG
jgi:CheY-like chemotaxis protein